MFCIVLQENLRFCLFIISCVLLFSSCNKKNFLKKEIKKGSFSLLKENDSLYYLTITSANNSDKWKLPYPVYQFQTGDVDGNGIEDALIGVIKPTRFDSIKANRLFIFKNYRGLVRPLWLGSRLSQPLVNFSFKKKEKYTRIRSVEREKSGKYLVAEYKWRKFGLEFTKYLRRETDSISAIALLEK
ncbi:hypothetical protein [Aquimarina muelleri]|uniref:Uncharacterized protein n=1 Tax=Aquimarina muelleri TaxID=279356 RepID=A0A918N2B7_9FLAO|nr:hypothetical protein [Aquimarina muelleri]MCX2761929.1 hypothetical protein [Aquimarina muelleri]GGX10444.1 hypothetical protein GCM10007384_10210 [Aquimarina muelleri]